jgi:hypothetical protein
VNYFQCLCVTRAQGQARESVMRVCDVALLLTTPWRTEDVPHDGSGVAAAGLATASCTPTATTPAPACASVPPQPRLQLLQAPDNASVTAINGGSGVRLGLMFAAHPNSELWLQCLLLLLLLLIRWALKPERNESIAAGSDPACRFL